MKLSESQSNSADSVEVSAATASKYLVIEGPIGVGKSSLCRKLATTFDSPLLLEKPAENPFLARFYKSPKRYALPTQLFFLFQRVRQLSNLKQEDMFSPGRVADFMLDKDPIFAQMTLDDDEFRLYQQVFNNLAIDQPEPDLMVYLQAPVNVLQERIRKRGIKYEQDIDANYLQRLSDAYTTYFHRYSKTPLLIVNAADINPIENEAHYQALLQHIDRIDAGKHFFNPLVP
ncbi:deoxyguanosine kinase/deoxyadenosine kinase [Arenicella chitinivorans]|uniref:Deoxyguanosine kinase/deoxyadenosine kinase n=1 Tax=Arenicella chitinivorans TaxID=1329800 RepID=A0A918RSX3_9GAMM|nr:deoxynucleoside kinase [Arenicella chitinivorans]GHA08584.1 deoxyguanosine kinase/deoxyadenosine kinase [Arenicella chitinivorans]